MFASTSYVRGKSDTQQLIQTIGVNNSLVHSRCRREQTGHHYTVGFVADETWHQLSHAASSTLEVGARSGMTFATESKAPALNLYDMMYKAIAHVYDTSSDVDRRLGLMLREVCQSDCRKVERDAVAGTLDMYLGRIRPDVTVGLPTTQFLKRNFTIVNRATKEETRMTKARPIRLKLRRTRYGHAGYKRRQATADRPTKRPRQEATKLVEPKTSGRSRLIVKLPLHRDGLRSEIEEITRMMARWHL